MKPHRVFVGVCAVAIALWILYTMDGGSNESDLESPVTSVVPNAGAVQRVSQQTIPPPPPSQSHQHASASVETNPPEEDVRTVEVPRVASVSNVMVFGIDQLSDASFSFSRAVTEMVKLLDRGQFNEQVHLKELGIDDKEIIHKPDFGTNPSMQVAFDRLRRERSRSLEPFDESSSIPLLGCTCTVADFALMLNMMNTIDVVVGQYSIVVNGPARAASVWCAAVGQLLGDYVHVTIYPLNEGLARGWNIATHLAFVKSSPPKRSLVIANCDIMLPRGKVGPLLKMFHERPNHILLRIFQFAVFAMKLELFHKIGYTDEFFYPGYGEDVDLFLKLMAAGGRNPDDYRHHWLDDVEHYSNVNAKHHGGLWSYTKRCHRPAYHVQKFNFPNPGSPHVTLLDLDQPWRYFHVFEHPFNNPKIFVNNSWILDREHRRCTLDTKRQEVCHFNVALTKELEGVPLERAAHLGRFEPFDASLSYEMPVIANP